MEVRWTHTEEAERQQSEIGFDVGPSRETKTMKTIENMEKD